MKKFIQFMNPSIKPSVERELDIISLKSIRTISFVVSIFEIVVFAAFLFSIGWKVDDKSIVSVVSISACILLCAVAWLLSKKMLKKDSFRHNSFLIFKLVFYFVFSLTSILFDFRNYKSGNQMVTFYIVNLVLICFIYFKPWIGAVLISCSCLGLFSFLYAFDGAAHIQPLNLFALALASIASSAVRYHSLINISSNTVQLVEDKTVLKKTSRCDGLTGLLNRVALHEDANYMDDRNLTAEEILDKFGLVDLQKMLKRYGFGKITIEYKMYNGDGALITERTIA